MGRRPKPLEVKRLLGNPGKRRLPSVRTTIPVAELSRNGFIASQEPASALLSVLRVQGVTWLSHVDAPLLRLLSDALEDYEQLRGDPDADVRNVIAARGQVLELLDVLGLTPTGRARLTVAEIKRTPS